MNLMMLLEMATSNDPDRAAVSARDLALTYQDLYGQAPERVTCVTATIRPSPTWDRTRPRLLSRCSPRPGPEFRSGR